MVKPTQIRDAMETWLTSETGIAATPRPYIEDVVDQFRASHPSLNVVQMRVQSIRTDEGVMEPYGIADLLIELTYEVT